MSSALQARTGRHRQRYDDHLRLVAGVRSLWLRQNHALPGGANYIAVWKGQ